MADILAARRRIMPQVIRTPLVFSEALSERLGAEIWLKPEQWQLTGSFKVRGALNKMMQLSPVERARGVITASAGNHGQGVAFAAKRLGLSALVVTPEATPETKLRGIYRYGADVQQLGANYDQAEQIAAQLAQQTGRVFIHAFEDAEIVAGQGTVGWEIFEDQPNLDVVFIPAGGGGLMDGIGVVARALRPTAQVIGVQSDASPAWHAAFQAGRVVDVAYQDTWAEGLLGSIGAQNFLLAQRVVDAIHLVSEDAIQEAMAWTLKEHHWVLEGSGAVGIAAVLAADPALIRGRRIAIVLSGGNLDMARLAVVVARAGV